MSEQLKKSYKVFNTTHLAVPPTGHMLDFDGKTFAPGRQPITVECVGLPPILEQWREKRWVRVKDAASGEDVVDVDSAETQPILTAGSHVQEVSASSLDEFDEEDIGFDPVAAREAALPNGAHMPSINQMQGPDGRARISLGSEDEGNTANTLSPIPGDRPRSVDDSEHFTVRAPRNTSTGGVISGR